MSDSQNHTAPTRFVLGDLVHIAKDLGPHMQHFQADVDAIVIGSYGDQYGGDDHAEYTVLIEGQGECSWYSHDQLRLIQRGCQELLKKWRADITAEDALKGSLDWIFNNGQVALEEKHPATLKALAQCLGIDSLWGEQGEGCIYHRNSVKLLALAGAVVAKGDKQGWLDYCEKAKGKLLINGEINIDAALRI